MHGQGIRELAEVLTNGLFAEAVTEEKFADRTWVRRDYSMRHQIFDAQARVPSLGSGEMDIEYRKLDVYAKIVCCLLIENRFAGQSNCLQQFGHLSEIRSFYVVLNLTADRRWITVISINGIS